MPEAVDRSVRKFMTCQVITSREGRTVVSLNPMVLDGEQSRLGRRPRKLNGDGQGTSGKGMSRKWPTRLGGFEKCFPFV